MRLALAAPLLRRRANVRLYNKHRRIDGPILEPHNNPPGMADEKIFHLAHHGNRELVLNKPDNLNELDLDMIKYMQRGLTGYERNEDCYSVVLRNTGTKAFCASSDFNEIYKNGKKTKFFKHMYNLILRLHRLERPLFACMNGFTSFAGTGLAMHAQARVATNNTVFALPETAIGFFPDNGIAPFLSKLDGHLGMFLALTGTPISGYDAVRCGLATHYLDSSHIEHLCERLSHSYGAHYSAMSALEFASHLDPEETGYEDKPFTLEKEMSTINNCFGQDTLEECVVALEADKLNPEFAEQCLDKMSRMSPLSLKLTYRHVQKSQGLSLKDSLKLDYRVAQNLLQERDSDYFTGIKARIFDRVEPKWKYSTIADVSSDLVESFFEVPAKGEELVLDHIAGDKPYVRPSPFDYDIE